MTDETQNPVGHVQIEQTYPPLDDDRVSLYGAEPADRQQPTG